MTRVLAALTVIAITGVALMAQPDRPLVDAMRAIYGLRTYTAFDWIGAVSKGNVDAARVCSNPAAQDPGRGHGPQNPRH